MDEGLDDEELVGERDGPCSGSGSLRREPDKYNNLKHFYIYYYQTFQQIYYNH
jgi:hypothetical protein